MDRFFQNVETSAGHDADSLLSFSQLLELTAYSVIQPSGELCQVQLSGVHVLFSSASAFKMAAGALPIVAVATLLLYSSSFHGFMSADKDGESLSFEKACTVRSKWTCSRRNACLICWLCMSSVLRGRGKCSFPKAIVISKTDFTYIEKLESSQKDSICTDFLASHFLFLLWFIEYLPRPD